MAFLDGAPPERLCQPIVEYVTGGWRAFTRCFIVLVALHSLGAQLAVACGWRVEIYAAMHPAVGEGAQGAPIRCLPIRAPPTRPVLPPVAPVAARGGEVRMKSGIRDIELNPDGSVKCVKWLCVWLCVWRCVCAGPAGAAWRSARAMPCHAR